MIDWTTIDGYTEDMFKLEQNDFNDEFQHRLHVERYKRGDKDSVVFNDEYELEAKQNPALPEDMELDIIGIQYAKQLLLRNICTIDKHLRGAIMSEKENEEKCDLEKKLKDSKYIQVLSELYDEMVDALNELEEGMKDVVGEIADDKILNEEGN